MGKHGEVSGMAWIARAWGHSGGSCGSYEHGHGVWLTRDIHSYPWMQYAMRAWVQD